MNALDAFEKALLAALLDGVAEAEVRSRIEAQLAVARVVKRELSGSGVFVHFEVPSTAKRIDPESFHLGDVHFESSATPAGGAAILFVREGRIDWLELYCHDGSWPESWPDYTIRRT